MPFSERTMLRILSKCTASVRKSLQGLDYIAAEGAKSFDDLSELINQTATTVDLVAALQEKLKAAKLYLKGDYKVNTNVGKSVYDVKPSESKTFILHALVCTQFYLLNPGMKYLKRYAKTIKFCKVL